jgi:hypothetical protein
MEIRLSPTNGVGSITETGENTNVFVIDCEGTPMTLTYDPVTNVATCVNDKNGDVAEYTHKYFTNDGKPVTKISGKKQGTLRACIYFWNKIVKTYLQPAKPQKVKAEKKVKAPKEKKAKTEKKVKAVKAPKEKKVAKTKDVIAKKMKVVQGEVQVESAVPEVILDGETNAFIAYGKKFFLEEKEVYNLPSITVTRSDNKESMTASLGNRDIEDVKDDMVLHLLHKHKELKDKKIAAKK